MLKYLKFVCNSMKILMLSMLLKDNWKVKKIYHCLIFFFLINILIIIDSLSSKTARHRKAQLLKQQLILTEVQNLTEAGQQKGRDCLETLKKAKSHVYWARDWSHVIVLHFFYLRTNIIYDAWFFGRMTMFSLTPTYPSN